MKNYVFVSHDLGENRALYYKGMIDGSYWWTGNVNDAMRYDIEEVADIISKNTSLTWLGFSVIRIEDCTFEKLKTDEALQEAYYNFLYVVR